MGPMGPPGPSGGPGSPGGPGAPGLKGIYTQAVVEFKQTSFVGHQSYHLFLSFLSAFKLKGYFTHFNKSELHFASPSLRFKTFINK